MAPAIHHIELWTTDLEGSRPQFDWLLTSLGWEPDPVPGWDSGMIWRAATGEYLVLEQSPAVSGPLDRMHAGVNHLALTASDRDLLDRLRDEAPRRGWTHLFPDRYPHAGGPDSTALYLENSEGFEVEIVVIPVPPSQPQ